MHGKILGLAFAMAAAAPVHAGQVTAKDPSSVVTALQEAGYQAQLEKDKGGDPLIRSASSGSRFSIFFYSCTDNEDCAAVQFYTAYDTAPGKAPSLEKINEWNRDRRFGRAYIDTEGDPVVEMDVDLDDGGISQALFTDNLEYWVAVMTGFESYIGW